MNIQSMLAYYRKACDGGDIIGCANLAVLYETDDFRVGEDVSLYEKYRDRSCRVAANQGEFIAAWHADLCKKANLSASEGF